MLGFELLVHALVATAVAAAVHTLRFQLENLLCSVALGEVDGDGAEIPGFVQARRNVVDDIDACCAAEESGIGAEEAYGASAEDGDSLACAEA